MSQQDTVINENIIRKARVASSCFMGLGQIVYLKQYLRGVMFALIEFLMLFFCVFEAGTLIPNFKGPVIKSLIGLITLGDHHPELPVKLRDHSIFIMITGLIVLILVIIFAVIYFFNIVDAKRSAASIVEKQRFPTYQETRNHIQEFSFP